MSSYDTNLAGEYYVLACLHRLGIAAALTLGNKKGVDIMVARTTGDSITVEVKGVAKKYDWPASDIQSAHPERHYVVLVCFEGQIDNPLMPKPRTWVIPYPELQPFLRHYQGRINVSRSAILKEGAAYEDLWTLIEGQNVGRELSCRRGGVPVRGS
jgi:hypothetical protein